MFLAQFWFPGGLLSPRRRPLLLLLVPVHTRNSTLAIFLPSFNILCTPSLFLLHLVFIWESNSLLISRFGSYFLVVLAKRSFLSYLGFVWLSLSRCNRSVSKNCISFPVQQICCDSFHCLSQQVTNFFFLLPLSLSAQFAVPRYHWGVGCALEDEIGLLESYTEFSILEKKKASEPGKAKASALLCSGGFWAKKSAPWLPRSRTEGAQKTWHRQALLSVCIIKSVVFAGNWFEDFVVVVSGCYFEVEPDRPNSSSAVCPSGLLSDFGITSFSFHLLKLFLLLASYSSKKLQIAGRAWEGRKRNWRWHCELWNGWWWWLVHAVLDWHHHWPQSCKCWKISSDFQKADNYSAMCSGHRCMTFFNAQQWSQMTMMM